MDAPLDYEIQPDPEPDEAAAIVAALAQALRDDEAFAPPAGLREPLAARRRREAAGAES